MNLLHQAFLLLGCGNCTFIALPISVPCQGLERRRKRGQEGYQREKTKNMAPKKAKKPTKQARALKQEELLDID